jgi:hypothetical protein
MRRRRLTRLELQEFAMLHEDAGANRYELASIFGIGHSHAQQLIKHLPSKGLYKGLASYAHPLHKDDAVQPVEGVEDPEATDLTDAWREWLHDNELPHRRVHFDGRDTVIDFDRLADAGKALVLMARTHPDEKAREIVEGAKVETRIIAAKVDNDGLVTGVQFRSRLVTSTGPVTS